MLDEDEYNSNLGNYAPITYKIDWIEVLWIVVITFILLIFV